MLDMIDDVWWKKMGCSVSLPVNLESLKNCELRGDLVRMQQSYQEYLYVYVQAALYVQSRFAHNDHFSVLSRTEAFFCQML